MASRQKKEKGIILGGPNVEAGKEPLEESLTGMRLGPASDLNQRETIPLSKFEDTTSMRRSEVNTRV